MEATRILTSTMARGIDGDMYHEDETLNIDPHNYALSFVTRSGMAGTVRVGTSYIKVGVYELVQWTYSGRWNSVDDEPYGVTLYAEFTVPYE